MKNKSDETRSMCKSRRDYLQSLSGLGISSGLILGQTSTNQQIDSEVTEWANQNNLSDIAQWQFSPTPGYNREDSLFTNPYPNDNTVYVGDLGGKMHAVNIENGVVRWSYEQADLPIWSRPVVHQNKVYFGTGEAEDNGSVYAVDVDTGEEEWVSDSFNGPIQSPMAAANGIIYFSAGEETYAVDSETGEQLWSKQMGRGSVPVIRENTAYFYTGSPTALDAESGDVIWEANSDFSTGPHQPLVTESGIYAGNGYYDIETGEEIFTFDGRLVEESIISNDYIFTRQTGAVRVFDADSGDTVRDINVSGNIRSMLSVDQTLYVGTANTEDGGGEGETGGILHVIDAETGEYRWAASARNAELRLSPHIDNGFVFIAGTNGQLYAVEHGVNPFSDTAAAPTIFQSLSDERNSILVPALVGVGGIATYLGYQKFRSGNENKSEQQNTVAANKKYNTGSAGGTKGSQTELEVSSYDELDVESVIKQTPNYQLQQGKVMDQSLWILTPTLDDSETMSETAFETFSQKIKLWSRIDSHPHLVSVYGVGTEPIPWAAIEKSDDTTFADQVDTLSIAETVDALEQICEAVHHVHRYGTTYENLGTESVLYTDSGTVKLQGVLDVFEEPNLWYYAPEEFDDNFTEQSAVYRIGLIAYKMFTGTLPYEVYPTGSAEDAIQSGNLVSISEQVSGIPPQLEDVVMTALSRSPPDRHETVLHFRDSLSSISNE